MKPLVGGFEVQPLEKKGSYLSEHWLVWLSSSWLSWTRLMVSNDQTCLCFLLGERRWPLSRAVHGTAPMVQEGSSGAWDWWAHGRWGEMGTWTTQGHAKSTHLKQSFAVQEWVWVGGGGIWFAWAGVAQLGLMCAQAVPLIPDAPPDHPFRLCLCRFSTVFLAMKAPLKRGLSDSGCHSWMNYLGLKPSVYSWC